MHDAVEPGLRRAFQRNRLDARDALNAPSFARLHEGLAAYAGLLEEEAGFWAVDHAGQHLVWLEKWLDTAGRFTGVMEHRGSALVTCADWVGVRRAHSGKARLVIRDFKAKTSPVHPQGDTGLQVRAIWAAHQAAKHGPQLFGTDVALDLDDEVVDVETVNLLFAGTDTFVIRRSVLPDETAAWAGDIVDMVDDAQELHGLSSPDLASAQPSGLCHEYCPFLHRCRRGQEHVAATAGPDALDARIGRR